MPEKLALEIGPRLWRMEEAAGVGCQCGEYE